MELEVAGVIAEALVATELEAAAMATTMAMATELEMAMVLEVVMELEMAMVAEAMEVAMVAEAMEMAMVAEAMEVAMVAEAMEVAMVAEAMEVEGVGVTARQLLVLHTPRTTGWVWQNQACLDAPTAVSKSRCFRISQVTPLLVLMLQPKGVQSLPGSLTSLIQVQNSTSLFLTRRAAVQRLTDNWRITKLLRNLM
jgi:hypothetical protein